MRLAQTHLDEKRRADTMVTQSETDAKPTAFEHGDWQLTPVPLTYRNDQGCSVAGLIMLARTDIGLRLPRLELLQIISQCLLAAGDTIVLFYEV